MSWSKYDLVNDTYCLIPNLHSVLLPAMYRRCFLKVWSEKNTGSTTKVPGYQQNQKSVKKTSSAGRELLILLCSYLAHCNFAACASTYIFSRRCITLQIVHCHFCEHSTQSKRPLSTILNGKVCSARRETKLLSGNFRCLGLSPTNPPDSSVIFLVLHLF